MDMSGDGGDEMMDDGFCSSTAYKPRIDQFKFKIIEQADLSKHNFFWSRPKQYFIYLWCYVSNWGPIENSPQHEEKNWFEVCRMLKIQRSDMNEIIEQYCGILKDDIICFKRQKNAQEFIENVLDPYILMMKMTK